MRIGVEHQECGVVLVIEGQLADASGIGVFGDVALPTSVDQNAAHHQLRVDEKGDLGGVHVGKVGAQGLRHLNRNAVVFFDRGRRAAGDPRRISCDHRLVVGETAGGQDHSAPRPDCQIGAVLAGDDPGHPTVALRRRVAAPGCPRCFSRRAPWRCRPAASSACSRRPFRRCACSASAARGRAVRVGRSCCTGTRFRRRCTSDPSSSGGSHPGSPQKLGLNGTPQSTSQSKCSRLPAQ